eukprot:Hpha_TRINITY_DN11045_c0_g1::TRINITY_DN11045_c0_g1_i2::g.93044::m.93044
MVASPRRKQGVGINALGTQDIRDPVTGLPLVLHPIGCSKNLADALDRSLFRGRGGLPVILYLAAVKRRTAGGRSLDRIVLVSRKALLVAYKEPGKDGRLEATRCVPFSDIHTVTLLPGENPPLVALQVNGQPDLLFSFLEKGEENAFMIFMKELRDSLKQDTLTVRHGMMGMRVSALKLKLQKPQDWKVQVLADAVPLLPWAELAGFNTAPRTPTRAVDSDEGRLAMSDNVPLRADDTPFQFPGPGPGYRTGTLSGLQDIRAEESKMWISSLAPSPPQLPPPPAAPPAACTAPIVSARLSGITSMLQQQALQLDPGEGLEKPEREMTEAVDSTFDRGVPESSAALITAAAPEKHPAWRERIGQLKAQMSDLAAQQQEHLRTLNETRSLMQSVTSAPPQSPSPWASRAPPDVPTFQTPPPQQPPPPP